MFASSKNLFLKRIKDFTSKVEIKKDRKCARVKKSLKEHLARKVQI